MHNAAPSESLDVHIHFHRIHPNRTPFFGDFRLFRLLLRNVVILHGSRGFSLKKMILKIKNKSFHLFASLKKWLIIKGRFDWRFG